MDYLVGQRLLTSQGRLIDARDRLSGSPVWALYFSAHWCPPCRGFTPVLRDAYRNYVSGLPAGQSPRVQVVFVSSDRSEGQQLEYMRESHGDWPAVPAGSALAQ